MSALGGVSAAAASSSTRPVDEGDSGFGELTNSDFFDIIMAELGAQDPLEPNDTQALLEQISLIRGIESDENVTESLQSLTDQNEFAAAAGLIGSLVSGVSTDGRRVADLVTSVSRTPDGTVLNLLDGSRVRIDQVDEALGPIDLDGDDDDAGDVDPDNGDPDDGDPDDGDPGDGAGGAP